MRFGFAGFNHCARAIGMRAFGLVLLAASAAGPFAGAHAASLSFNGTILLGVNGVNVGGSLYDVSFSDSAIGEGDFLFTSIADVHAAGDALSASLKAAYPAGVLGTPISSFDGCTSACNAVVLSALTVPNNSPSVNYAALVSLTFTGTNPGFGSSYIAADPLNNYASVTNQTWTHWNAAPVPEPESYAMLLAGLCLVGTVVARSRRDRRD